ncbi:DUF4232 domain-containing protein [Streptomyces sp. NPDC059122]|uniref:DUF4232 domain-containing protein n=1 Tax=unclassified Streptomyces TaxID=2593676 RepID=UPI00367AAD75
MRTFRHRTAALTAASTAVLALALTACGGGGAATKSAGPAPSDSAAVGDSGRPAEQADTSQGNDAAKDGATGHTTGKTGAAKGSGTGGNGSGAAPACNTKDVAISAAYQDGPPYTHIVLTAKNTSGHRCTLKGYPEIQFLESHRENVPPVAKSKPQLPVVLNPGDPAYALVKLSDGGVDENNEPVTDFSVTLQGGSGQAAVKAPGREGIAVDPAKWATGYWTYELRNGADDF